MVRDTKIHGGVTMGGKMTDEIKKKFDEWIKEK